MKLKYEVLGTDGVSVINQGIFDSAVDADQWVSDQLALVPPSWDPAAQIRKTDVTLEVQAEIDEETGLAAMLIGQRVIARLYAINQRKGWALADKLKVLQDPQLALAERLLHDGSPVDAKGIILQAAPAYYTADEIATILAPIG